MLRAEREAAGLSRGENELGRSEEQKGSLVASGAWWVHRLVRGAGGVFTDSLRITGEASHFSQKVMAEVLIRR